MMPEILQRTEGEVQVLQIRVIVPRQRVQKFAVPAQVVQLESEGLGRNPYANIRRDLLPTHLLSVEQLSEMCAEWRAGVFRLAGKIDPKI